MNEAMRRLDALVAHDPVLECLAFIASHHERPAAPTAISAGLALDASGRLPFHQAESAVERIGLRGEILRRPLAKWRSDGYPALIELNDGGAAVLLGRARDEFQVYRPGDAEPVWRPLAEIEPDYAGTGLIVTPDLSIERGNERPWAEQARSHWFWREVWKVRGAFGFVIAAAVVINLLAFALPLFTMNVYDRIIPNKAQASLWVLAIGVMFAFTMDFILRLARSKLVDETGRVLDAKLSQKLFEKVMNLPMSARTGSTGALARRVSEFEQVREFFASTTVVLVVDLFFLVFFVILIAVLGGWLAVVPVATIIIMTSIGFVLQKAMRRVAIEAQTDSSLQNSILVESISGIETLKACRGEGRMLGRWRRYAQASASTQEHMRRLTAASVNLASLCQQVTSIALVIGGFYLFDAGSITMGAIIAIVMLAGRSLAPVGQLAFLITRAQTALTTLDGLQSLMDREDERNLGGRATLPEVRDGTLSLEKVSFTYPGASQPSLRDITLHITPGERIGIVGRVASGKSTLGRVICGLYPPSEGIMLVDGLDSRQHHPHELRSKFRFVGQDAELFSGSIRDNLLLGAHLNDDARLMDALRRSGADRFFARDAAGFDLHIGERGNRLSGGQRSFLVLARALVEPCHLLYLDEPTGAMDSQTEALFIEHLGKALDRQQTLVVSTHRNAMLSLVDRLIVVDAGTIIADGPRDVVLGKLASAA
jgi:ATP-binding cassette subfamily C protein LapB